MLPVKCHDFMVSAADPTLARRELLDLMRCEPPLAASAEEADLLAMAGVFYRMFSERSVISDVWPLFADFPGHPSLFKFAVSRYTRQPSEWDALLRVTDEQVELACNLGRWLAGLPQRVSAPSCASSGALTFVSGPMPRASDARPPRALAVAS